MKSLIDRLNQEAEEHEANGGKCKTILVKGQKVKCCLDQNDEIMNYKLRVIAQLTNQIES